MSAFPGSDILETLEDRGYPVDYLYARLRGRRSKLTKEWRTLVYEASPLEVLATGASRGGRERTAEGIWVNLLREHRWVYLQMNGGLRGIFAPYFLYAELRTLFIGLRHIREERSDEAANLLSQSLLLKRLKDVLAAGGKEGDAVAAVERIFLSLSGVFAGLRSVFEEEGPRGFEQELTNRYLVHVMSRRIHPLIRTFFGRIIDARNILGLYKALRLCAPVRPAYLPGGAMTPERFREILKGEDLFTVKALIREATGIRIDAPDISKVECALYRGISKLLKKEGRDPLGIGLLLDYLWRCSIEAMNLSVLAHTREIDRESVISELVY